jgi:cytochrome c553
MRKLTVLSVVAASLLLIGCGQDKPAETKAEVATPAKTETVSEKATKAVEATKEAANAALEKAKVTVADTATKAVEATKEVATAAAEKTAEVAKNAKEAVAKAVAPATSAAPASYSKCAGCHGKDGKMKALGKSEIIAGQAKADLVKKIGEYKAGTRNANGMGTLMKGQVAGLTDADIDAIATYVSGIK